MPLIATPPSSNALEHAQLLERARAAVGELAPVLRHLSAEELAARAERLLDGIRQHAGRFLSDAQYAARDVATNAATRAEQLVTERLTTRIRAKVAPPIRAAIVIALAALLVALLALYRTRSRP